MGKGRPSASAHHDSFFQSLCSCCLVNNHKADDELFALLSSPGILASPRSRSGSTYQRSPQAERWLGRLEEAGRSQKIPMPRFDTSKSSLSVDLEVPHVIVVDPISTGMVLAQRLAARGLKLIRVWSDLTPEEIRGFVAPGGENVRWEATIEHQPDDVNGTLAAIRRLKVKNLTLMCGCETGVNLSDYLSEGLQLRGNGTTSTALRRNKFLQSEQVRRCGLDAVKQKLAMKTADVDFFVEWHNPTPFEVVVKPTEGAGTDGVTFCNSVDEMRAAYDMIMGKSNIFGQDNVGVLLQEFLQGQEYVVDTVSMDGEHKVLAMWKYDKRPFNGAKFVYYGMQLLSIESEPLLPAMVKYVVGVLDAIGIENGAVHSEVMATPRGPVLVECNCRMHGGEGTWEPMAQAAFGYSQVSVLMDAFLQPATFKNIPAAPTKFQKYVREAKLRSDVEGILKTIDSSKMAQIRLLPSYQTEFLAVAEGSPISRTIDAVTACGNINLVNEDKEALQRDYDKLHAIVEGGMFTV